MIFYDYSVSQEMHMKISGCLTPFNQVTMGAKRPSNTCWDKGALGQSKGGMCEARLVREARLGQPEWRCRKIEPTSTNRGESPT